MSLAYYDQLSTVQLSDFSSILEKILPLLESGLKEVFDNPAEISLDLFKANFEPLLQGITYIEYGKDNAAFLAEFKKNTGVFAAFKTHTQQKELVKELLDADGKLRSFAEFQKATKGILKDYNRNYLMVEYNTAVRSGQSAKDWQKAVSRADTFPNLKYTPSLATERRENHKKYYNIVRPINDPFWNKHLPPNGWQCQCGFESSDEEVSEIPNDLPAPVTGFGINPGKHAKIVDDSHPYYPKSGDITKTKTYLWLINILKKNYG